MKKSNSVIFFINFNKKNTGHIFVLGKTGTGMSSFLTENENILLDNNKGENKWDGLEQLQKPLKL